MVSTRCCCSAVDESERAVPRCCLPKRNLEARERFVFDVQKGKEDFMLILLDDGESYVMSVPTEYK